MSSFEKIKEKISSVTAFVKTRFSEIASNIRKFLGELYDIIVFAPDEDYNLSDGYEKDLVGNCQNIVVDILGENPLSRLVGLSPEERAQALQLIITRTASSMNIEVYNIVFDDLDGLYGYYSQTNKIIAISILQIIEEPMTLTIAREMLDTVFHELRHAYQHNASKRPSLYRVDRITASIWNTNFKYYLPYSRSPKQYFNQPVERDARNFALSTVNAFNS